MQQRNGLEPCDSGAAVKVTQENGRQILVPLRGELMQMQGYSDNCAARLVPAQASRATRRRLSRIADITYVSKT